MPMNRASQHAWVTDEATVALVRRLAEYYLSLVTSGQLEPQQVADLR